MYDFQCSTMVRMEQMTRAERLAADERAGRLAHELGDSAHGLVRWVQALRRGSRLDAGRSGHPEARRLA